MSRNGLVLEGGAMRGLFTCGVLDTFMEKGIEFDGAVGISAGACFGCNLKSHQPGRALRYNERFAHDRRYAGLWSLLTTGGIFGSKFAYYRLPLELDPFDIKAFDANPMEFYAVCTDVLTGKPVYQRLMKADYDTYEWIRASAAMPLVSKVVRLDGRLLLDGGVGDSIPLEFFESIGYERKVVILTQPKGYQKEHLRLMPLMRIALRKYPEMIAAMDRRHVMYNQQLEYVAQAESEGRCLVIRPDGQIPIGHISHDAGEMRQVYEMGRSTGNRFLERVQSFFS
jgi:predicted patatin/cPLA2 family phospholipase